jgi:hypothetical protein
MEARTGPEVCNSLLADLLVCKNSIQVRIGIPHSSAVATGHVRLHPNGAGVGYFHLGIDEAAGHARDDQRPDQIGVVAHPNRQVRDTLALVLVNLTSVCWLPSTGNRPQTVRRSSAVVLAVAFVSQHNQLCDQ